jgi:hypothetical protein
MLRELKRFFLEIMKPDFAFGYLKGKWRDTPFDAISPFDSNAKTYFIALYVLPIVIDTIEIGN